MSYTYTKTGHEIVFANKFKCCSECHQHITGVLDIDDEPLINLPCEHQADYYDDCPTWNPVDGCTCKSGHK